MKTSNHYINPVTYLRTLICVLCLSLFCCLEISLQSAQAQVTALTPTLYCIREEADGQSFTAEFGYENFTNDDYNLPLTGGNNFLSLTPNGNTVSVGPNCPSFPSNCPSFTTFFPKNSKLASVFTVNFRKVTLGNGLFQSLFWTLRTQVNGQTQTKLVVANPNQMKPCPKPVVSELNCIFDKKDLTPNPLVMYFGYKNMNPSAVHIPVGDAHGFTNYFDDGVGYYVPASGNKGQTTTFQPGTVKGAFFTAFQQNLHWATQYDNTGVTCSAGDATCAPLVPSLECVDFIENGTIRARFNYRNDNGFTIQLPLGHGNRFAPGAIARGQPTSFLGGNIVNAFNVTFDPAITPNLSWTLNGTTVTANKNSKSCSPIQVPICVTNALPPTACQGTTTELELDARGSMSPQGQALSYSWTTDCQGATLTNPSSAVSKILLTQPGTGQEQMCSVNLLVQQGNLTASCSTSISVSGCDLDCLNQPNGAARLDRCGVCDGDGLSCLDCINTNMRPLQLEMDSRALDQFNFAQRISRNAIRTAKGNTRLVKRFRKIIAEAQEAYNDAWTSAWAYPEITVSCANVPFCVQNDNFIQAANFQEHSSRLLRLALEASRIFPRKANQTVTQVRRQRENRNRQANSLHQDSLGASNAIPRFSSVCSPN